MDGFTRLVLPEFGGDGFVVMANDQMIAIDGASRVSLRVPIGRDSFTNASVDNPDQQLVAEMHHWNTNELEMRFAITPRERLGEKPESLYVSPRPDLVILSIEIAEGNLIIRARGIEDDRQHTLVSIPLNEAVTEISSKK